MTRSLGWCGVAALLVLVEVGGCSPYRSDITYVGSPPETPPVQTPEALAQEVIVADVRPPPVSGGTLLVSRDGATAVVADPDRDRIVLVDLAERAVRAALALLPGDEPGRAVEDAAGRAHVLLRRGGAVVTVDLASQEMLGRRAVCPAPRGIAYDDAADVLQVACAGGELVTLAADPALPDKLRELRLLRDLRDVVVKGDSLFVSRFRSAQLLTVDAGGSISDYTTPPPYHHPSTQDTFVPAVVWRAVGFPGGIALVHQRSKTSALPTADDLPPAYYGPDCGSAIVHAAVTILGDGAELLDPDAGGLGVLVLPVDLAVSRDGVRLAVVGAGNDIVVETLVSSAVHTDGCGGQLSGDERFLPTSPEPIAVAYDPEDNLLVQTRHSTLEVYGALTGALVASITLPGEDRRDSGHALFHRNPDGVAAIACASCHPEGRDDGRVYDFEPTGRRRTQSVAGAILDTAPFHWDGDLGDLGAIMDEVFVHRMAGLPQSPERLAAFESWLATVPGLPASPALDPAAAARGAQIFNDPAVGCATCHAGPKLTNNTTVDVGTGKPFQVPSLLGVSARAPFLHDGCAAILRDRFGPCGGGDAHGHTSGLTPAQIDDLVAFLETI